MSRQWDSRIFLSFVSATAVAGGNVLAFASYEPIDPTFRYLIISMIVLALAMGPFLTYFGVTREMPAFVLTGIAFPALCAIAAIIIYLNGSRDSSRGHYREATVVRLDRSPEGSAVHKVHARLNDGAGHRVAVWTSGERFEQLREGAMIGIPARAGALGIEWRVKGEPIRLIQK